MFDTTFWIALAGAVLAAASLVLHVVAPRTKTTIDDTLRDDVDEVLAFIRAQKAPAAAATVAKVGPVVGLLLVVLALGATGATLTSCAAAGAELKSAETAIVDCVHADAAPIEALLIQLASDAITAALHGAVDWGALEDTAEAQGAITGGCAYAELVHGRSAPAERTLVAAPDPALVALERLRSKAGGARWRLADGTVQ